MEQEKRQKRDTGDEMKGRDLKIERKRGQEIEEKGKNRGD